MAAPKRKASAATTASKKAGKAKANAEGTQHKRTPKHIADLAAGKDEYHCEAIVGEAMQKGVQVWQVTHMIANLTFALTFSVSLHKHLMLLLLQVKWKDWDAKHNTWEPLENLGGCEAHIAEYRRVKDTANQEAAKKVQERVAEKQRQQKERDDSIAIAKAAKEVENTTILEIKHWRGC